MIFGEQFDLNNKLERIKNMQLEEVNSLLYSLFDMKKMATATLGPNRKELKFN